MKENLLISIIMPVKDTERFIVECLESIENQSENNWELIAVNDGSSDNSLSILKEFSRKDGRILVFNNTGNGIIDALRLAYSKSKGDFITRMDSDDIMSLDKLKVMKTNLLKSGRGHISLGLVIYFSETELGLGFKNYENWLNELISKGTNFEGIYKECVIPSPCWMVFREDLENCEAFRPNDYPEDYDLAFRFYSFGLKPIPCNKVLHYWRDYLTRTSRTHIHYADNTFLEIKARYFLNLEYDSSKNLIVWGAGDKGKKIAKILIEKGIEFFWICDNPKKIGKHIYEQEMLPFTELEYIKNSQSIITVANLNAQKEIKKYFEGINLILNKDYFFFC
ncbi:MAG: glycosyltransferase [Flavobacteriaceae bacterium]|nr:glycosyltransferase [Flavobacteriaceae bacterium]